MIIFGGPFRAIPTSVPGVHFGELMPEQARLMDRVAVVRGLDRYLFRHAAWQVEPAQAARPAEQEIPPAGR